MKTDLGRLLWPLDRLADALEELANRAGYGARSTEARPPDSTSEPSRAWMHALAGRLGVELEPVVPLYRELPLVIRRAAPALLQVRMNKVPCYLVLLGTRGRKVRLLGPDATVALVDPDAVAALVRAEKQDRVGAEVDHLLSTLPSGRKHEQTQSQRQKKVRQRVRTRMLLQRLGEQQLRTCWMMPEKSMPP